MWSVSAAAIIVVLAVGCSGDDDPATGSAPETTGAVAETTGALPETSDVVTSTTRASNVATTTSAEVPSGSGSSPVASTMEPTEPIATVPEEGVPGIDSTNPFCRGWSEFAGSFQTLAFASIAGSDPVAAARLEVVASGAVSSAAQTLADEFPDAIASERDVFLDGVIGPFARRAGRAGDDLRDAGLGLGDIERLGDAWLAALVDIDDDDPAIVVAVPGDLEEAVGEATAAFSANVPQIAADPSLVTQAQAPATLGHLADNCPDQGILSGNDAID